MVIDLYGLTADQVRDRFPAVFRRVVDRVKPEGDHNNRTAYRNNWGFSESQERILSPRFLLSALYLYNRDGKAAFLPIPEWEHEA